MLYSTVKSGASNMRLVGLRVAARFRRLSEIIFAPKCVCVCVCVYVYRERLKRLHVSAEQIGHNQV